MVNNFGLLGRRLGHSYSPELHALFGAYSYSLIEVEPEQLAGVIESGDFAGFNVTVPYKCEAARLADRLCGEAAETGAVNTLTVKNGFVTGYNTDCYGFAYLLDSNGIAVEGKRVLIIGNGGAAAAVRLVLSKRSPQEIITVSRSLEGGASAAYNHTDCDILINATPVGMHPDSDEAPVELEKFKRCDTVIDLIYNPLKTELLCRAEVLGKRSVNGLGMLAAQAAEASRLFTGRAIAPERIDSAVEILTARKRNVVLIGMPGSGKTTVGRLLAEQLGRRFVDTDELFCERFGLTPADCIKTEGEACFRERETEAVKELSKENSLVLACGGGTVLAEKNAQRLSRNGVFVHIRRPLSELAVEGRPLSESLGVETLWAQRGSAYEVLADVTAWEKTPEQTAKRIAEELKKI